MKNPDMRHPGDEKLLRYADGELPPRPAAQIRAHLEACWECRAQLQEFEKTIANCVGYRKNVLQRHFPTPPAPWIDIHKGFAQMDASAEPDFFKREREERMESAAGFRFGPVKKWALAAVALLAIGVVVYRFRQAPSVQAAELLRKAVAAETHKDNLKPRRIRIRTRQQSFTRMAALHAAGNDSSDSMRAMFTAARYDWTDPLSAKAYAAWRDQLPEKSDEVVQEQDVYRLRTSADKGELRAATLTFRVRDFHPIEERFEFRNREWVEITELTDEAPPDSLARDNGNPVAVPESARSNNPPPSATKGAPSPEPAASATIGDELHVIATLHQLGADLGDPIEVSLSSGNVLVTGIGIAPQRQREVNEALARRPRVVVRFSDPAPGAPRMRPERETQPENAANPDAITDIRQLQTRMAETIGGRANLDQVASQVLELSDGMMSRVYALRRLAERFPSETEGRLNAADLQLLTSLRQEHAAGLRQKIEEIDRVARPLLATAIKGASSNRGAIATLPGDWQSATEDLFQSVRHVEKLLAVVFGAAPVEAPAKLNELPAQLLSSLTVLRVQSGLYDRLTAPSPERSDR